jgi:hydroxyethylthiazole kinase-like uncharacterized protein yjeF
MQSFDPKLLENLYKPLSGSSKGDNGQVAIIGGSALFHGAPLLALTTASRIVDMVYFSSPETSIAEVANQIKSKLFSFIWTPWTKIEEYIGKSDAILIGPGFMRYGEQEEGDITREITKRLLGKFPDKHWVIDAGSLQTIDTEFIPAGSILTPNQKEYKMIFGDSDPVEISKKYSCVIVIKGPTTFVYGPDAACEIKGGNAGMTKGGTGDVQAGLTVALLAKNGPFLAASAAAYLIKKAADDIYAKQGTFYNADDLARSLGLYFPQNMR